MGLFGKKFKMTDEDWARFEKEATEYYQAHPEKAREYLARQEEKERNKVRCVYCHSTNVKKITATGRMVSVATLGLAGNKVGKEWHCNNCGSNF